MTMTKISPSNQLFKYADGSVIHNLFHESQTLVVQRLNNTIHGINHYPLDESLSTE